MGKGSRNRQRERSLPSMDMSQPVVKGKARKQQQQQQRQPRQRYSGGIAGVVSEVEHLPDSERDWFAEGRCFRCHRNVPKKALTRNVALDGKGYCKGCFDRLPRTLRSLGMKQTHDAKRRKRQASKTISPHVATKQQRQARKQSNSILNSIPGNTIEEKLDSVARGLATQDPKPVIDYSPGAPSIQQQLAKYREEAS